MYLVSWAAESVANQFQVHWRGNNKTYTDRYPVWFFPQIEIWWIFKVLKIVFQLQRKRKAWSKPFMWMIVTPLHIKHCVIHLSVFPTNQLECTRLNTDFYDDDTSEDEDDYSTQAAAPQLISTDEVFSFSSRPSRDPWIDGGDPLQISTCPYCYLTLPFSTLQWHTVIFLKQRI